MNVTTIWRRKKVASVHILPKVDCPDDNHTAKLLSQQINSLKLAKSILLLLIMDFKLNINTNVTLLFMNDAHKTYFDTLNINLLKSVNTSPLPLSNTWQVWLMKMLIKQQVCRGLVTIKGCSKMRSYISQHITHRCFERVCGGKSTKILYSSKSRTRLKMC